MCGRKTDFPAGIHKLINRNSSSQVTKSARYSEFFQRFSEKSSVFLRFSFSLSIGLRGTYASLSLREHSRRTRRSVFKRSTTQSTASESQDCWGERNPAGSLHDCRTPSDRCAAGAGTEPPERRSTHAWCMQAGIDRGQPGQRWSVKSLALREGKAVARRSPQSREKERAPNYAAQKGNSLC